MSRPSDRWRVLPKEVTEWPDCHFCDEPVNTLPTAGNYELVVGWAQRRRAGGANKITLRRSRGKFAHRACVDRAKSGAADQTVMFWDSDG